MLEEQNKRLEAKLSNNSGNITAVKTDLENHKADIQTLNQGTCQSLPTSQCLILLLPIQV